MNEQEKKFREAVKAARLARVLAVTAAKADLTRAIRRTNGTALENAWYIYDARIAKILKEYNTSISRARARLNEAHECTTHTQDHCN